MIWPIRELTRTRENIPVSLDDNPLFSRQYAGVQEGTPMFKNINHTLLLGSVCVGAFMTGGIVQAQEVKNAPAAMAAPMRPKRSTRSSRTVASAYRTPATIAATTKALRMSRWNIKWEATSG